MKDRTFWIVMYAVLAVCVVVTLAHFLYAVYAYQHCSIIPFIGKELWW